MAFFMLILHPGLKRAILETFQAKFGRKKFSPLPGGTLGGAKNDHF